MDQEGETERRARGRREEGAGDPPTGGRAASPAAQSVLPVHGIHQLTRSGFSPSGAFEMKFEATAVLGRRPRARSPFSEGRGERRRRTAERPARRPAAGFCKPARAGAALHGLRGGEGPAGRAGAGQRGRQEERAPRARAQLRLAGCRRPKVGQAKPRPRGASCAGALYRLQGNFGAVGLEEAGWHPQQDVFPTPYEDLVPGKKQATHTMVKRCVRSGSFWTPGTDRCPGHALEPSWNVLLWPTVPGGGERCENGVNTSFPQGFVRGPVKAKGLAGDWKCLSIKMGQYAGQVIRSPLCQVWSKLLRL